MTVRSRRLLEGAAVISGYALSLVGLVGIFEFDIGLVATLYAWTAVCFVIAWLAKVRPQRVRLCGHGWIVTAIEHRKGSTDIYIVPQFEGE